MTLTTAQRDRAAGVLLGTAAGDALGAGYEFGPPLAAGAPVTMKGGGGFGWAPGEWTDDTSMAIVLAQVAGTGTDLRSAAALDLIAQRWAAWARVAKDVGVQTRTVLAEAGRGGTLSGESLYAAARAHYESGHQSAGNGALMRTAPVALAYLHDDSGLIEAATTIAALTHADPEAGEACVLWCLAIRHAVLTGELDVRRGLRQLPTDRAASWLTRIEEAERRTPADFGRNGWVVEALQAAWSAIAGTPVPVDDPVARTFRAQHLLTSLENAVRGGRDADTVAAIAGGLLGAAYGASAVPAQWRRILHGWPGLRSRDLIALADRVATREPEFTRTYSYLKAPGLLVQHPDDPGLWLGDVRALDARPATVTAVVSLCRVAPGVVPDGVEHIEVRLIDLPEPSDNEHLHFVLHDTVATLQALRNEGREVLLHCVAAQSRTPTVAALYGAAHSGRMPAEVLRDVRSVLPHAKPNARFAALLAGASGVVNR